MAAFLFPGSYEPKTDRQGGHSGGESGKEV